MDNFGRSAAGPLRHGLRRATSPRGGGKFLLSVVYASYFSKCFLVAIAVPHPSRLRRSTFPPGEGFLLQERYRVDQGKSDDRRTGARIVRPHCGLLAAVEVFVVPVQIEELVAHFHGTAGV